MLNVLTAGRPTIWKNNAACQYKLLKIILLQKKKKKAPGVCPKCKKGFHWLNECHSKFDKDGNTLTPEAQQKQQGN